MNKNQKIIIGILLVIIAILSAICVVSLTSDAKTLKIDDINLEQDALGIYELVGHITPERDYDYVEARITIYDNNSVVIGKSSCAWNMRDLEEGQKISLDNGLGATCEGTPKYAVIEFYDSVYSEEPIANATIHFLKNDTSDEDTSSVDTSSSQPSAYAYKSDGTPMYSQSEVDDYMMNKYGKVDYHIGGNGYIDMDEPGFDNAGNYVGDE